MSSYRRCPTFRGAGCVGAVDKGQRKARDTTSTRVVGIIVDPARIRRSSCRTWGYQQPRSHRVLILILICCYEILETSIAGDRSE